ncbi:sugar phosphate isomerase/epimerase family protein [Neobacillus pocheonensis]|uniref:TIM barrel protein n=1 Tax=Neobacillus pocheonensis TaxID=363869 RepID=UPI003D2DE94D
MFKYSFCNLVWFKEELSKSVDRLARFGYDAIDLYGEPSAYKNDEVRQILKNNGLVVSSICALYSNERDLAHPDPKVRKNAQEYVKSVIDMAAEVGALTLGIAPTACMKTEPLASPEDELKWAVEGIQQAAELAETHGIKLVFEAWNRYEHYWLNRVDQCLELMKQVDRKNVGVMGDVFHMNIEETSVADALRNAGSNLLNIHLADSNRAAPGVGHFDFVPVMQALKDINYQGYVSYEILPAAANPFGVLEKGVGEEWLDQYAEQCITHIKNIEKSLLQNTLTI